MTTAQMRERLIKVYPASSSWAAKVKAMDEGQVFAIHARFVLKGIIK